MLLKGKDKKNLFSVCEKKTKKKNNKSNQKKLSPVRYSHGKEVVNVFTHIVQ